MADTWADLAAKTNLSLNDLATAINTLMANERLLKGGTASVTPSTTLEALAASVAAGVVSDSYEADTSSAVTLVYTDGHKVFNPTASHDVNLAKTGITKGYKRTYFNRSETKVLTFKATNSTPGDGGTVCIIMPLGWVTFQARQDTPTSNTHWMQVDAGGGWADWGGSASNFYAGYGTVTAIDIFARRQGGNMLLRGKFQCGTVAASTGDILIPHGQLLDDTIIGTGQETMMGHYNMVYDTTSSPIWATDNNSGIFYYRPDAGKTKIQTTSRFAGGLYENRNVNAYIASGANITFSDLAIPISGFRIG